MSLHPGQCFLHPRVHDRSESSWLIRASFPARFARYQLEGSGLASLQSRPDLGATPLDLRVDILGLRPLIAASHAGIAD